MLCSAAPARSAFPSAALLTGRQQQRKAIRPSASLPCPAERPCPRGSPGVGGERGAIPTQITWIAGRSQELQFPGSAARGPSEGKGDKGRGRWTRARPEAALLETRQKAGSLRKGVARNLRSIQSRSVDGSQDPPPSQKQPPSDPRLASESPGSKPSGI